MFFIRRLYKHIILITNEKIIMKYFNHLCLLIIVLVFFGCSSKKVELCEGDLNKCAPNEDCHCWK